MTSEERIAALEEKVESLEAFMDQELERFVAYVNETVQALSKNMAETLTNVIFGGVNGDSSADDDDDEDDECDCEAEEGEPHQVWCVLYEADEELISDLGLADEPDDSVTPG